MANYPQELAQDAVCQSHTGHMTGLWFLPARPLRLNTNEWMKAETKDKEITFFVWILRECRDASCIVWELSLSLTYLQENVLPWVRCKCSLICNDNRKSVPNYVCTVYLVSWYLPHLELNTVKPSYNDIGLCDISSVNYNSTLFS